MLYSRNDKESFAVSGYTDSYFSSSDEYLRELIAEVPEGSQALHFASNGRYALQDLIVWISRKMGANSSVLVSSFNITSDASATLLKAFDRCIISDLRFILNGAKKTNSRFGIEMIQGKFPISFSNNHSKVACISCQGKTAVILSSGNLSAPRNREAGVIFFNNTEVYEFHHNWMSSQFI